MSLQGCLAASDVVVSAVPSTSYKVKTEWLKDGSVCVNVAADKNFEKDVRDKVRPGPVRAITVINCADVVCSACRPRCTCPPSGRPLS